MNDFLQILLRCTAVYAFMMVALRLAGKKELSQLNTSDIILILLISNAVQNAMVGNNTSLWGGLMAAAVLFVLNTLLKFFIYRNRTFRDIVNQHPLILVHHGQMNFDNLSKLSITHDELMQAIREHGLENIKDVKWAIFETDGNISVISGDTQQLRHTHYKHRIKHAQTQPISS